MKCKLTLLLVVLLAFLALLPGCGKEFGTKISSISVNGNRFTPVYVYQLTDVSRNNSTDDYSYTSCSYLLEEDRELGDVLYIVSQQELSSDSPYAILIYTGGSYINSYVVKGTLKKKAVKEFNIQKKDNGDTFLVTYYNFDSRDTVFESKSEAEEAVKTKKTTVEVVKDKVIIYYK